MTNLNHMQEMLLFVYLTNMVYALDPNNSVLKRLWCTYEKNFFGKATIK